MSTTTAEETAEIKVEAVQPVVAAAETATEAGKENDTAKDANNADSSKRPKRRVAIIFGYIGERYSGLQWNHDPLNPTVEQRMLEALHAADFISKDNMGVDVMQKLGWERASRTDKGVHALRNLISVRLMQPANVKEGEDMWSVAVKLINEQLPSDIHVYRIVPVTRSFNGYQMCHGRKYEYFLPTFALMNQDEYKDFLPVSVAPMYPSAEDLMEDDKQFQEIAAAQEAEDDADGRPHAKSKKRRFDGVDEQGFERMMTFRTVPDAVMQRLSSYRISAENLERARKLFSMYRGTQKFHNFTPRGRANDPSTTRFISSVTVDDPVVVAPGADELLAKDYVMPANYAPHGLEWVRIELEGQSFMLNQIRKMIGAVSSVMLSGSPDETLLELLKKDVQRGIPMAPANGLFLSHLDFTMYNLRLDRIQEEGNNGEGKMCIRMEDVDAAEVTELRRRIVDVIARREMRENVTGRWMRSERHVIRLAWNMEIQ